jgi:cephalosporin-C deacetylase
VTGTATLRVFEVAFNSGGGVRIGGWITRPRAGEITRGMVVGHGYGGREEPAASLPVDGGVVAIFPCARGFGRSRMKGLADTSPRHVLHGIESKETYVHRGCVADWWNAASALLELYPEVTGKLDYMGASFGGGIGAMALAWDKRYRGAFLDVPAFGQFPLRATGEGWKCTGSWEAVRGYYRRHPQVLEVLAYFDSAVAARHVDVPVMCACALFDPAVAPAGQFAVYNALHGRKNLFVREAGHFAWEGEAEEQRRLETAVREWFAE